jgi:hypothetical protein
MPALLTLGVRARMGVSHLALWHPARTERMCATDSPGLAPWARSSNRFAGMWTDEERREVLDGIRPWLSQRQSAKQPLPPPPRRLPDPTNAGGGDAAPRQQDQARQPPLTEAPDAAWAAFIDRARSNLHWVLAMSPVGDALRTRWGLGCRTGAKGPRGPKIPGPLGQTGPKISVSEPDPGSLGLHFNWMEPSVTTAPYLADPVIQFPPRHHLHS